jgi:hypothetical protein
MISFSVSAPIGTLSSTPVGRVPGGYRVQVGYDQQISFEGVDSADQAISGHVVAGSDWVMLRDDGVALFSAKVTFEAAAPHKQVFDSVLTGRVALDSVGWKGPIRSPDEWRRLNGTLRVTLPIQFETSGPPPDGASKAMQEAAAGWATFADLARHQFMASGEVTVTNGSVASMMLRVSAAAEGIDPILALLFGANEKNWPLLRNALTEPVLEHAQQQIPKKLRPNNAKEPLHKQDWANAESFIRQLRGLINPNSGAS